MSLTNYEIQTYRDAIEHLTDVFAGQDAVPRTLRIAHRAISEAYRELPTKRAWHYYQRVVSIATVASQTTGTIVYDHTGGAYERMVTLSSATWPADARYYNLLVGRNRYEIADRKSATVITLEEWSNPGDDLASTGYTLYRDSYPLPDYFDKIGSLIDTQSGARVLAQVEKDELLVHNHGVLTTSLPHSFAIVPAPHYPGGMAVEFGPSPTTARTYDAAIRSKGKPLKVEKECTGTVAITAGSTAVVGTGTAFTSDMEGAILRVAPNSQPNQLPTGPMGSIEQSELDNPYAEQFLIKSVETATALTLETSPAGTYTANKFTISSRLDVEPGSMLTYFLRLCEAHYARLESREDRREREAKAEDALRDAGANDNKSFAQAQPFRGPFRLRDLATSVNFN